MTRLAHSHSALKLFEQCPKRYWYQRVAEPRISDPGGAASAHGERVHKALEDYIRRRQALPDFVASYANGTISSIVHRISVTPNVVAEREVAFTADWTPTEWFARDAWLRAKLDVSAVNGDRGMVLDWKTGKRTTDTDQLELFALVLMMLHPQIERTYAAFVWLRDGSVDTEWYPRGHIGAMRDKLMAKIERVEHAASIDHWPARPSRLCRWCPARHLCPDAE